MKKTARIVIPLISSAVIVSFPFYSMAAPTQGVQMNPPGTNSTVQYSESASDIVYSEPASSAAELNADYENATSYTMSDENNQIKITEAGTYIVTGSCSNGNITVKKGTTGVVLILQDLSLTSTTGACVSLNKTSEVKLIISGTVNLTDAENPDDENSSDADVADAFDGAAIKIKDGADAYITGTGTLTIDSSACKNGIKSADDSSTVCIIDGPTITINAANDAINSGYDLTILSGSITISAGDDGLHADRILTIGSTNTSPVINITDSNEGLEGTVVNIIGGTISLNADDDGINAANSDGTYSAEMDFSINILGGNTTVNSSGDGVDSNGYINLIAGELTITSTYAGGEAGLDFDLGCYISNDFVLNNNSGVSFDSGTGGQQGGQPGGQPGQQGRQPGGQQPDGQQPGGQQPGGQPGQMDTYSEGTLVYDAENSRFIYVVNSVWDQSKFGFVRYNNGLFLVVNGVVATGYNGLFQDPDNAAIWYFLANGQVVLSKTGLVQYDGSWFYLENGRLDTAYNGFVTHNDGSFLVARGRIVTSKNGLTQDPNNPNEWYFLANGQVQLKKTGIAVYNGAGFYVVNGKLDSSYTGTVTDNGVTYNVANGQVL